MAETVFAIFRFEAQIHAPRLIVAKVGAAGDFQIGALAGSPDFDVVGLGGAEPDVARAELDDAVVQTQCLQDFFGVGGQFFQLVHAGLRRGDFDQLDFIKLVHADQATRAQAGAASFATEAGCVSGVADGQLFLLQDFFAMQVCDRDLSGRDEVKVIFRAVINLVAKLGQLTGADEAFWTDKVRRVDLRVAVLAAVEIEQKVDQCTLQARSRSTINDESAARDFDASLEVQHAERGAKHGVVLRLEVVAGLAAPGADFGVFLRTVSDWAGFMREIGNAQQQISLAGIGTVRFDTDLFDSRIDAADFGFDGAGILAVFLGDADFLADAVAVALQLLALGFSRAAGSVDGDQFIHHRGVIAPAIGEALFDQVWVLTDEADVEHRARRLGRDELLARRCCRCLADFCWAERVDLKHGFPVHEEIFQQEQEQRDPQQQGRPVADASCGGDPGQIFLIRQSGLIAAWQIGFSC